MSEKPVKILLPKERFQIGTTPTGEPVWVEPKELLPTEDEKLELKENMLNAKEQAAVQKMAALVFSNAARFVQDTFYHIAPKEVIHAHEKGEMNKVAAWAAENSYEVIQDGLLTVIKFSGKIIRKLVPNINPSCADLVERRVRKIVANQNL